jgi:hypothetical protein
MYAGLVTVALAGALLTAMVAVEHAAPSWLRPADQNPRP